MSFYITKEESRNIRRDILNIEIEHEKEITRHRDEVTRLNELLEEKDKQIERATTETAKKNDQLKEKDDLLISREEKLNDLKKLLEEKEGIPGGPFFIGLNI